MDAQGLHCRVSLCHAKYCNDAIRKFSSDQIWLITTWDNIIEDPTYAKVYIRLCGWSHWLLKEYEMLQFQAWRILVSWKRSHAKWEETKSTYTNAQNANVRTNVFVLTLFKNISDPKYINYTAILALILWNW